MYTIPRISWFLLRKFVIFGKITLQKCNKSILDIRKWPLPTKKWGSMQWFAICDDTLWPINHKFRGIPGYVEIELIEINNRLTPILWSLFDLHIKQIFQRFSVKWSRNKKVGFCTPVHTSNRATVLGNLWSVSTYLCLHRQRCFQHGRGEAKKSKFTSDYFMSNGITI